MHLGSCIGYTGHTTTQRYNIDDIDHLGSDDYRGKIFFDGENYLSIIECLNGGHGNFMEIIECMEDKLTYEKVLAQSEIAYSKKWKSRFSKRPIISSYHTTKRAQIQTVNTSEELVQIIKVRCNAIQHVIDQSRTHVKNTYRSGHLGFGYVHYRAEEMKRLFKNAHSPLRHASKKCDDLRKQEKRARHVLDEADDECKTLKLDPTTSKSKLKRANNTVMEKQNELIEIKEKVAAAEKACELEKATYRIKATDIFKQCQKLQKEQLKQIRQTLIAFVKAVHSVEYSKQLDSIYGNLILRIQTDQNSNKDLDFWAQHYGVDVLTKSASLETHESDDDDDDDDADTISLPTTESRNTKESQKIETPNCSTTKKVEQQSIVENDDVEDEQLATVPATTPTKTKGKKSNIPLPVNKKNDLTTEPKTPSTAGLNQV